MRTLFLFCFCLPFVLSAQTQYEPNDVDPYGQKNPEAPKQLDDYKPMIGTCDCESQNRNPDQSWADPVKMTWTFSYIMNGDFNKFSLWFIVKFSFINRFIKIN